MQKSKEYNRIGVAKDVRAKYNQSQECIPVECVPTAVVAVTTCQYWGGVCLQGEGLSPKGGGGSASKRGPCRQPTTTETDPPLWRQT